MVRIMLNQMVSDYSYKPRMQTAKKLHQLYLSEHVDVPSVEDVILRIVRLGKGFNMSLHDELDGDNTDELMELCMLIGVDFEDVEPYRFTGGDVLDV